MKFFNQVVAIVKEAFPNSNPMLHEQELIDGTNITADNINVYENHTPFRITVNEFKEEVDMGIAVFGSNKSFYIGDMTLETFESICLLAGGLYSMRSMEYYFELLRQILLLDKNIEIIDSESDDFVFKIQCKETGIELFVTDELYDINATPGYVKHIIASVRNRQNRVNKLPKEKEPRAKDYILEAFKNAGFKYDQNFANDKMWLNMRLLSSGIKLKLNLLDGRKFKKMIPRRDIKPEVIKEIFAVKDEKDPEIILLTLLSIVEEFKLGDEETNKYYYVTKQGIHIENDTLLDALLLSMQRK